MFCPCPERAVDAAELAVKFGSRGVVGVDIAGDELLPMDPRHIEGFKKAKDQGLHITIHAAESGPAANVREAAEIGAERIGHGYHVLDDPEVYQFAKEQKLHFEVSKLIFPCEQQCYAVISLSPPPGVPHLQRVHQLQYV